MAKFDRAAVDAHRRAIAKRPERVTFMRITGVAPNTKKASVTVNAIVRDYVPTADVLQVKREGSITQGMRHFIVMEDDLRNAGFPVPLVKNDKAVVRGETLNITVVDALKRASAGAIELVAVGV